MKEILTLLLLVLNSSVGATQGSYLYVIKYVGLIEAEGADVQKVKLPTIITLFQSESDTVGNTFVEANLINDRILLEAGSPITSHSFKLAKHLERFFKYKRKSLPLIVVVNEGQEEKEIRLKIPWRKIKFRKRKGKKRSYIEINLKKITLEL